MRLYRPGDPIFVAVTGGVSLSELNLTLATVLADGADHYEQVALRIEREERGREMTDHVPAAQPVPGQPSSASPTIRRKTSLNMLLTLGRVRRIMP